MMRYIYSVISLLIISIFIININAYAYEIDGSQKGTEWENSTSLLLLKRDESNNNINFGTVNWAIEDGSLFLCFNFSENGNSDDVSLMGVSLIVEDSEEFIITVESSPAESDSTEYHFEGAVSVDYTNGGICEIRVGDKYGFPSEIPVKVRFIDSDGSYSNVYYFTVYNKSYTYAPYDPDDYTEKTQETTTKNSQTTTYSSSKTTKVEKTTKRSSSKTTKRNSSGLFDLIFDNKEESTTKPNAESSTKKTSSKTKKTSAKTKINNNTQNIVTESSTTEIIESATLESQSNNQISYYPVSTTEGTKYKILTAIFGGITLVTVAILGTVGANRKANKKNKNNKSDN